MKTKNLLQQLNWNSIFGNTSQYENLYDFLKGDSSLREFINGFYPKSKNKKLLKKELNLSKIKRFKKHAKQIWNLARVNQFSNGDEFSKIQRYLKKLK